MVSRRARLGRRSRREPGCVDPLLVRDPGCGRTLRGAGRRSAPLQHRGARGMAALLRARRSRREARHRPRPGRLSRGARVPGRAGRDRALNPRLDRLRESLEEPLLVTNPTNIFYLFGFKSSNAALLVEQKRVRLFSDFRYAEAARAVEGVEFEETRRALLKDLADRLSGRIGFEQDY